MTQTIADRVVQTLHSCLGTESGSVPLHAPEFRGNEWNYVKECLDTGWVSSVGRFVDRFESDLAAFTGVRSAVAVVNGTAALHMCLMLVGVEPGDEVLIPALTFVATANAVRYCGAVPHFVDSDCATLGLDVAKLEAYLADVALPCEGGSRNRRTGRRIRAVVPMHTFGHPVDLEPLAALCERFGLALVEDAAESLGSYYQGRHTGQWGHVTAVSFNGNKIITTGGGGAILTNDEALGRRAKHLTTTAKVPHRWRFVHDEVGYNYRLPNLNAALGCAQLELLPEFLAQKRRLAERYIAAFEGDPDVTVFREPAFARSNYWLNVLMLRPGLAAEQERILAATNDAGLMTRPPWNLMSELPMFAGSPSMDLATARDIADRAINIPSSATLG